MIPTSRESNPLNINSKPLVGKYTVGKHSLSFVENYAFVVVAGREMPKKQAASLGLKRYSSCLTGRAVIVEARPILVVGGISALVIEQIHVLHLLPQVGHIACIGKISITSRLVGLHHKPAVSNNIAIGSGPVGPVLYIVYLTDGNVVEVYHVATYVWKRRLLAYHVATTGHTMLQRNGDYTKTAILIDGLPQRGVNRMELHLKLKSTAKHSDKLCEYRFELSRSIDMERSRAPQHAKSADESDESEAVIAMQMGYEYGLYASELDAGAAQLQLGTLATIEHYGLTTYFYNL